MVMAKIIEFYIPQRFQKNVKWVPQAERGKVLEFPFEGMTSAPQESAAIKGHPRLEDSKADIGIYTPRCRPESGR
jgi:hypothetical protein